MTGVHADVSPGDPDDPDNTGLAGFGGDREPCGVETVDGTPCRRPSLAGVDRCEVHFPEDGFANEP